MNLSFKHNSTVLTYKQQYCIPIHHRLEAYIILGVQSLTGEKMISAIIFNSSQTSYQLAPTTYNQVKCCKEFLFQHNGLKSTLKACAYRSKAYSTFQCNL